MTSFSNDAFSPAPAPMGDSTEQRPRVPDPGSRLGAKVAWVLSFLLMTVLVVKNQVLDAEAPVPMQTNPVEVRPPEAGDAVSLTMKFGAAFKQFLGPEAARQTVDSLAQSARTDAEKVRLAIVAGELVGEKEALARLAEVKAEGVLADDVRVLREAYEGAGKVTDPAQKQQLIDRHGWFGKLASLHGVPDSDPAREELFAFVGPVLFAMALMVGVLFVAVVGGIAAFISMLVQLSNGKIRRAFVPPAPGGSVYLEVFPFFVAGFLALSTGFALYAHWSGSKSPNLAVAQLATQWVLALFPLYPVVFRGVPFAQWRREVGLHSGAGFWREVGAGIYGYFAGLPLLAAAIMVSFAVIMVKMWMSGPDATPPQNPIMEVLGQGSTAVVVALFVLATCWAPLVEETVLRGCLFRHLRSRWKLVGAAVVSALFFGLMHGYNILLLSPVITIGFVFALMREWRGSLIGSITAHFLHNATVMTVVLVLLYALQE